MTTVVAVLQDALDRIADADGRTPCQGPDAELWTSDDEAELHEAARRCRELACPLLQVCADAAMELRASAGCWGGQVYTWRMWTADPVARALRQRIA